MTISINKKSVFIFDLDDTLFHEIDYLYSAYREIAGLYANNENIFTKMISSYHEKKDVFSLLMNEYPDVNITKDKLLTIYRNHKPDIQLLPGAKHLLDELKHHNVPLILITDGRSTTQRNKIEALGIATLFNEIFISEEAGSEKKEGITFQKIHQNYSGYEIFAIGDNINKDFAWPQKLGWTTIGLRDNGKNIHSQEISRDSCPPTYYINSFTELYLQYE